MMSYSAEPSADERESPPVDLHLEFDVTKDGKTYINRQFSRYPYHICRAQYIDTRPSGLATVYVQSSSGGIFESDDLYSKIVTRPGAQAHITTQASTIVHSMYGAKAKQSLYLESEEGSYLEFLPDPLILFPESDLKSLVYIRHHPESTILYCDGFCQHDPRQQSEPFRRFLSQVVVEDHNNELLCLDRYAVTGEEFSTGAPGIMGSCAIQSTFLVLVNTSFVQDICHLLISDMRSSSHAYIGVTVLPSNCGVLVRTIASEVFSAKQVINQVWEIARDHILGHSPSPRRK